MPSTTRIPGKVVLVPDQPVTLILRGAKPAVLGLPAVADDGGLNLGDKKKKKKKKPVADVVSARFLSARIQPPAPLKHVAK